MARFIQTFNILFAKLPFSDTARVKLRVWAEAVRRELCGPTASGLNFQATLNAVYDAVFITTAGGADLDSWGAVLGVPRAGMGDAAYRAALLVEWRATAPALTVQAITDAVNTQGATYAPVISVVRVHEHYNPYWGGAPQKYGRREDGVDLADTVSLGDTWGVSKLDRLTFSVELNRTPTAVEALGLAEEVQNVKLAQARGFLVTDMGLPLPPRYRAYGEAYSIKALPWSWDDEFYRPLAAGTGDLYRVAVGTGGGWSYLGTVLFGDASANAALADVLVPREDVAPVVVDEKNVYLYAKASLAAAGASAVDWAGFAFRVQPASAEFYAVVFEFDGAAWKYSIQYFDGAAWAAKKAPAVLAEDLTVAAEFEIWVRGGTAFTVKIGGVVGSVKCTDYDAGADIVSAGAFGFVTRGTTVDITVDEWRYW